MKLTIDELLGLVVREIEGQRGSTLKGRAKREALALHQTLNKLKITGNEIEIESEEEAKNASSRSSRKRSSRNGGVDNTGDAAEKSK